MCQPHFLLSVANIKTEVALCLRGNLNALHCCPSFETRHRVWASLGKTEFPFSVSCDIGGFEPRKWRITIRLEAKHLYMVLLGKTVPAKEEEEGIEKVDMYFQRHEPLALKERKGGAESC